MTLVFRICCASLLWVTTTATLSPFPSPIPMPEKNGYWHTFGNHRFVLNVSDELLNFVSPSTMVTFQIDWRRIDSAPLEKDMVIVTNTQAVVSKCIFSASLSSADSVTISFSADAGVGLYFLYFMPFTTCEFAGGACPWGQGANQVIYDVDSHCTMANDTSADIISSSWARESRNSFESFSPMQIPMTSSELTAFLNASLPEPVTLTRAILVTETRSHHVSMTDRLPQRWFGRDRDSLATLTDSVQPGENYTFQVAVYAPPPADVLVVSALSSACDPSLRDLRCMNLRGTDFWGRPQSKEPVRILGGRVLPLWFALEVDVAAVAGQLLKAQIEIVLKDAQTQRTDSRFVDLLLNVDGPPLSNGGDDDLKRGTRLQWLDSRVGLGSTSVPAPYTPLVIKTWESAVEQQSNSGTVAALDIFMLGKRVAVGRNGLPQEIDVFVGDASEPTPPISVLSAPIAVRIDVDGIPCSSPPAEECSFQVLSADDVIATWASACNWTVGTKVLLVQTQGTVDCTGFLDYNVTVTSPTAQRHLAGSTMSVQLEVAVNPSFLFGMGLGAPGGLLSRIIPNPTIPISWKWDGVNGNNAVWVGSSSAGIRTKLKGSDPMWQAGVPYDSLSSPPPPDSWSNNGTGGALLFANGTFVAFTGERPLSSLELLFAHVITPVRPLNITRHWAQRWAHVGYTSVSANWTFLAAKGATVVNIHQGTELNPFINYPYLTSEALKAVADQCHSLGMKLSVYNTMRELSNHCLELFPMLALGETFVAGTGGGTDWLQEHLSSWSNSPAWSTPLHNWEMDAAIRTRAMTRWNNYYVRGIAQLKRDFSNDGIYLDEIAYDRVTLMRSRTQLGPEGVVDHHSDRGAFCQSPANNYMELFPFIDRLWYGEGFPYDDATADFWFIEMSGIPFGVTADMLRYPGETPYHFKGFVHAESNRWQSGQQPGQEDDPFTPIGLWDLWRSFGIEESEMFGWWRSLEQGAQSVPIAVSHDPLVKVTTYLRFGQSALVALSSFTNTTLSGVTLSYNFTVLGFDGSSAVLSVPAIIPFQPTDLPSLPLDYSFTIPANQGFVLLLTKSVANMY